MVNIACQFSMIPCQNMVQEWSHARTILSICAKTQKKAKSQKQTTTTTKKQDKSLVTSVSLKTGSCYWERFHAPPMCSR